MHEEPEKNWPFPPPSDKEAREYLAIRTETKGIFKNEVPAESGLDATEERQWTTRQ